MLIWRSVFIFGKFVIQENYTFVSVIKIPLCEGSVNLPNWYNTICLRMRRNVTTFCAVFGLHETWLRRQSCRKRSWVLQILWYPTLPAREGFKTMYEIWKCNASTTFLLQPCATYPEAMLNPSTFSRSHVPNTLSSPLYLAYFHSCIIRIKILKITF